ncbi:G2/mitotic-specific cyclin-B1-like isoform X2 [Scyliorhinus canicula]|uniref:G2/mitotic-specific cyclin-B1-like isoform X2 n=1 Tax=Scyliorhinus canicula TaxID=7830 RepID=UPI0018F613D9|nr:G2/mitotic-specific cyclin-B1-like isoform X2 [Scyliorhinus canicula]
MAARIRRATRAAATETEVQSRNCPTMTVLEHRVALVNILNKPCATLGLKKALALKKEQTVIASKMEPVKRCKQPETPPPKEHCTEDVVKPEVLPCPSPMDISACTSEEPSEAFSNEILPVEDVDLKDGNNPMLCSEYVKDVYKYLRELEIKQAVRPNYLREQKITGSMRAILIDWLVQVQMQFRLLQETMYLTVFILDRFIQDNPVTKQNLQLVGVTAMLVASKYEEIYPPAVRDFVVITDDAYSCAQIRQMERLILKKLDFSLGKPLPLHFLRRASKIAEIDTVQHTLCKYLMELTMGDYEMVHYPSSLVAASAFHLSQKVFHCGEWTPILQYYLGYREDELLPVMQHIAKNVVQVNNSLTKHMTIKNKYARNSQMRISTILQLRSVFIFDLSKPLMPS